MPLLTLMHGRLRLPSFGLVITRTAVRQGQGWNGHKGQGNG